MCKFPFKTRVAKLEQRLADRVIIDGRVYVNVLVGMKERQVRELVYISSEEEVHVGRVVTGELMPVADEPPASKFPIFWNIYSRSWYTPFLPGIGVLDFPTIPSCTISQRWCSCDGFTPSFPSTFYLRRDSNREGLFPKKESLCFGMEIELTSGKKYPEVEGWEIKFEETVPRGKEYVSEGKVSKEELIKRLNSLWCFDFRIVSVHVHVSWPSTQEERAFVATKVKNRFFSEPFLSRSPNLVLRDTKYCLISPFLRKDCFIHLSRHESLEFRSLGAPGRAKWASCQEKNVLVEYLDWIEKAITS